MKSLILVLTLLFSNMALATKPVCDPSIPVNVFPPESCVIVTYPNPKGGVIDFKEWMVMDETLRHDNHMEPGTFGSFLINNKIVYSKFNLKGDYLDVWTFDEEFVYGYITLDPTQFVRQLNEHDQPLVPRYAQLGFPGVRVVSRGGYWQYAKNCIMDPPSESSNTITEFSGPFIHTFEGNIGTIEVVSMKSYWDCHGLEPETCSNYEDYWYAKPYGWVSWVNYVAPNYDGNFVFYNGRPFGNIMPGGPGIHDWCFTPSLFDTGRPDPRIRKRIARVGNPIIIGKDSSLEGQVTPPMFAPGFQFVVTQNGVDYEVIADANGHYKLEGLKSGPASVYYIVLILGGGTVNLPMFLRPGINELNIRVW